MPHLCTTALPLVRIQQNTRSSILNEVVHAAYQLSIAGQDSDVRPTHAHNNSGFLLYSQTDRPWQMPRGSIRSVIPIARRKSLPPDRSPSLHGEINSDRSEIASSSTRTNRRKPREPGSLGFHYSAYCSCYHHPWHCLPAGGVRKSIPEIAAATTGCIRTYVCVSVVENLAALPSNPGKACTAHRHTRNPSLEQPNPALTTALLPRRTRCSEQGDSWVDVQMRLVCGWDLAGLLRGREMGDRHRRSATPRSDHLPSGSRGMAKPPDR